METRIPTIVTEDGQAELTRPLPPVPPAPLYAGAPEGAAFRDREAARSLAALGALMAGFHQPIRGPRRDPARWLASATLVVGGLGLLTHHHWPEEVSLVGCGLAVGAMLARPTPFDPLAVAAALTAALALADLQRSRRKSKDAGRK